MIKEYWVEFLCYTSFMLGLCLGAGDPGLSPELTTSGKVRPIGGLETRFGKWNIASTLLKREGLSRPRS